MCVCTCVCVCTFYLLEIDCQLLGLLSSSLIFFGSHMCIFMTKKKNLRDDLVNQQCRDGRNKRRNVLLLVQVTKTVS